MGIQVPFAPLGHCPAKFKKKPEQPYLKTSVSVSGNLYCITKHSVFSNSLPPYSRMYFTDSGNVKECSNAQCGKLISMTSYLTGKFQRIQSFPMIAG